MAETLTPVRHSSWTLLYQQKDISRDVAASILSLEYTDEWHGQSDDLQITLEDVAGRWRGNWFPVKGDRLALKFGYQGQPQQNAGDFEIDEIEASGPPSQIIIKAVAAGITAALRTNETRAYENVSLRAVAEKIAEAHKLKVTGEIEDIKIARISQMQQPDLTFLKSLAESYGHVFTVRGKKLVFHKIASLAQARSALTITPTMLMQWQIKSKTSGTVREASAS